MVQIAVTVAPLFLVGEYADARDAFGAVVGFDPNVALPPGQMLPTAILIAPTARAADSIAQIRARDEALADAPILVIDPHGPVRGADDTLSYPHTRASIEAWRIPPNAVVARLIAQFGAAAILPLLVRFRAALRSVDDVLSETAAHHLAGLAGTLGYADLAEACDAAQYGRGDDRLIRREVRKALYDLAQRLPDLSRET